MLNLYIKTYENHQQSITTQNYFNKTSLNLNIHTNIIETFNRISLINTFLVVLFDLAEISTKMSIN